MEIIIMKTLRTLRQIACFMAFTLISFVAESREGISVSPSATNDYDIPPSRNSNTILFDVSITGPYSDMPYRYRWFVDGIHINTVDLGNGSFLPNPKSSSFAASITYGYHSVSVTLQKMTVASPETWANISSGSTN
ncbi:MAG: hypothetical protein WD182_04355, partial [Bacteroidota bacterium]